MFYSLMIILLLASLLLGLILFVMGAILLIKVKNKVAGILVVAAGLAFTLCPLAAFLFEVVTVRIQS